jgi:hypothetical protein
MKKQNKKHQNAKPIGEKLKSKGLMFFTSFFHVICKISKHLAQASCTELILEKKILIRKIFHPTILFQTSYSQGRTIRLSRLNAWKGHLANFFTQVLEQNIYVALYLPKITIVTPK